MSWLIEKTTPLCQHQEHSPCSKKHRMFFSTNTFIVANKVLYAVKVGFLGTCSSLGSISLTLVCSLSVDDNITISNVCCLPLNATILCATMAAATLTSQCAIHDEQYSCMRPNQTPSHAAYPQFAVRYMKELASPFAYWTHPVPQQNERRKKNAVVLYLYCKYHDDMLQR